MSIEQTTRQAYWQQHILQFRKSGLSGIQYCAREDLTYHCFVYWRRKLMTETDEQATVEPTRVSKVTTTRVSSGFITVQPESRATASPGRDGLELSLPNGLIIVNIGATNLSLVGQLLRQL